MAILLNLVNSRLILASVITIVMALIAILSHINTDMTTTALFMITTQSEYTNSTCLLQAIVIEGPWFTHCTPRSTLVSR